MLKKTQKVHLKKEGTDLPACNKPAVIKAGYKVTTDKNEVTCKGCIRTFTKNPRKKKRRIVPLDNTPKERVMKPRIVHFGQGPMVCNTPGAGWDFSYDMDKVTCRNCQRFLSNIQKQTSGKTNIDGLSLKAIFKQMDDVKDVSYNNMTFQEVGDLIDHIRQHGFYNLRLVDYSKQHKRIKKQPSELRSILMEQGPQGQQKERDMGDVAVGMMLQSMFSEIAVYCKGFNLKIDDVFRIYKRNVVLQHFKEKID